MIEYLMTEHLIQVDEGENLLFFHFHIIMLKLHVRLKWNQSNQFVLIIFHPTTHQFQCLKIFFAQIFYAEYGFIFEGIMPLIFYRSISKKCLPHHCLTNCWSLQLPAELIIHQTNWISLSHIKWKSLITYNCVSPYLKLKQIISDY